MPAFSKEKKPRHPRITCSAALSLLGTYHTAESVITNPYSVVAPYCALSRTKSYEQQTAHMSSQDLAPSSRVPLPTPAPATPLSFPSKSGPSENHSSYHRLSRNYHHKVSKFPVPKYHSSAGKPKCVRSQASDHFPWQPPSPSPVPAAVHPWPGPLQVASEDGPGRRG